MEEREREMGEAHGREKVLARERACASRNKAAFPVFLRRSATASAHVHLCFGSWPPRFHSCPHAFHFPSDMQSAGGGKNKFQ